MSTIVYATADDYATWTGGAAPGNIASLLRSASIRIYGATSAAYYDADADTGLPTDAGVIEALKDATCAQAAVWAGLGIDPNLSALDVTAPRRSKRLGAAGVDYDTSAATSSAAFQARQSAATDLCEEAVMILQQAGLLTSRVWTYG